MRPIRSEMPLRQVVTALLLSVSVAGVAAPAAPAAPRCPGTGLLPWETSAARTQHSVLCLVNAARRRAGARPLRVHPALTATAAARVHAMVAPPAAAPAPAQPEAPLPVPVPLLPGLLDELTGMVTLSPTVPARVARVTGARPAARRPVAPLLTRLEGHGYGPRIRLAGEDFAWASGEMAAPKRVVQGLLRDRAHRAALLRRAFTEAGVAVAQGTPVAGLRAGASYVIELGRRGGPR